MQNVSNFIMLMTVSALAGNLSVQSAEEYGMEPI
jgi:hypothetical protein